MKKILVYVILFLTPIASTYSADSTRIANLDSNNDLQQIFEISNNFTVQIFAQVRFAFGSSEEGTSSGAGFLIDKKRGWILTNAHVAQNSPGPIDVAFNEQAFSPAKRVYIDPYFDIAIIGIDPTIIPDNATEAKLDCNHKHTIGLEVAAFGHPWGLRFTATRGIVSAYRYTEGYEQLQTDAALNSGNSGGALVDLSTGMVIGINTAKLNKKEKKSEGLNFAVPSAHVCPIVALLSENRSALPPLLEATFGRKLTTDAVFIARDGENGWSKLKSGDQIISIENLRVRNPADVITILRGRTGPVKVKVIRNKKTEELLIQVQATKPILGSYGVDVSGILFATPRRFGAEGALDGFGAYVANIQDGSTGSICGAQAWDLLISVDNKVVRTIDELYQYLTKTRESPKVKFVVRRWSRSTYLRVEHFILECNIDAVNKIQIE